MEQQEQQQHAENVELFRKALMVELADDWQMDLIASAAHICADALAERGQSTPLPTMTGNEVADALEAGREVEEYRFGWWSPTGFSLLPVDWRDSIGPLSVVARVVGEDPEPGERGSMDDPEAPWNQSETAAAPVPSEEPLPEGVALDAHGERWLMPGFPMPTEHEFLFGTQWHTPIDEALRAAVWSEKPTRVRPVPPPPEPEMVPWGVELIGRRVAGQTEPINFVGSGRAYGYCGTSVVWFAKCPPDGMVEVLPLSDEERG